MGKIKAMLTLHAEALYQTMCKLVDDGYKVSIYPMAQTVFDFDFDYPTFAPKSYLFPFLNPKISDNDKKLNYIEFTNKCAKQEFEELLISWVNEHGL